MDCLIVRLIDLPYSVHDVTVKDENGDYNMFINARLSADGRAAYKHEVYHIQHGHFYTWRQVAELEAEVKQNTAI